MNRSFVRFFFFSWIYSTANKNRNKTLDVKSRRVLSCFRKLWMYSECIRMTWDAAFCFQSTNMVQSMNEWNKNIYTHIHGIPTHHTGADRRKALTHIETWMRINSQSRDFHSEVFRGTRGYRFCACHITLVGVAFTHSTRGTCEECERTSNIQHTIIHASRGYDP